MSLMGFQVAGGLYNKVAALGGTPGQLTTFIQCRAGACLPTWESCGDKVVLKARNERTSLSWISEKKRKKMRERCESRGID